MVWNFYGNVFTDILSRVTKREGDIAKSLILKLDFAKKKGRLSFLKNIFSI